MNKGGVMGKGKRKINREYATELAILLLLLFAIVLGIKYL